MSAAGITSPASSQESAGRCANSSGDVRSISRSRTPRNRRRSARPAARPQRPAIAWSYALRSRRVLLAVRTFETRSQSFRGKCSSRGAIKRATLVSTPTHQLIEFDVDSPNTYARGGHLNNGLLGTGEPVLIRFFEAVGIGSEFAETSPLVSSVPRDARDGITVAHVILDVPWRSFDATDTDPTRRPHRARGCSLRWSIRRRPLRPLRTVAPRARSRRS